MLKIHATATLFLMSTACAGTPHTVIEAAAPFQKNDIIVFDGGNYMIAPLAPAQITPAPKPDPKAGGQP